MRKEWRNPKKVYVIDHSLKRVLDTREDIGRIYENLTFIELRRRFPKITYFKGRQEVDFFIEEAVPPLLLNVCYDYSSPAIRNREIKGLLEAMEALRIDRAQILTADTQEEIKAEGKTIKVTPLWKWLLSG